MAVGWVIHKLENTYTTEVHHWSEGSEHHVTLPNLGVRQQEKEFLENQTLKLVGFDCGTSTGLGEAETPLLEGRHKAVCTSGPRGGSDDPMGD